MTTPPLSLRAAVIAVAILASLVNRAQAQDTPREIRVRADGHLSKGNYLDAIPDLALLIQYYGESRDRKVIASMELIFYNLAVCHMFIGQLGEAETAFRDFLKRYPASSRADDAMVFIGDIQRYQSSFDEAIKTYRNALRKYPLWPSIKADVYASIARCLLAQDKWNEAMDPLKRTYQYASDFVHKNWSATLLTTAYFKEGEFEKVYRLTPYLLRPNSFASRSIAFNMAALEAGDDLFGEERYREALWVFRMVYPHDLILIRSEAYLEWLGGRAERIRKRGGDPRTLMRIQEQIGELELELNAIEDLDNYDIEMFFRIARGYMELRRFWEGREMFLHLSDIADTDLADEALFLAFQCSMQIQPWTRAFEIGEQYITQFPSGEFFDPLTLAMGQLYARLEDWPNVITHLTRTLQIRPNHESAAECMFLTGYASFMEEKFEESVQWLEQMRTQYPESELVSPATYWHAMALMFDTEYADAQTGFNRVLEEFPDSLYAEDSAFRTAVCAYGLSRHDEADERLVVFLDAYPQSRLVAEATMMQGDIAGALGRGDDAVTFYQNAMRHDEKDLHIEHYNHCAFQAGRILVEGEKYSNARSHFKRYIERNRKESNLPQAIYWVGVCLWRMGEQDGALRYYRATVEQYGADPSALGIDMILDEFVGRSKRTALDQNQKAWNELRHAHNTARLKKQRVLELRLARALLFHPRLQEEARRGIEDDILKNENLQVASPAVLQMIMDLAGTREQPELATLAAETIVQRFTETDYALDARMVLAASAIGQAAENPGSDAARVLNEAALRHLGVVREVYAASEQAGQALILIGDLHRRQRDYESADAAYKSVLGHKRWRNLWPEALYGRGECAFARRRYDVASAYYERIYVLYSHYRIWMARAYLRRAECLRKLYQNDKAREVLTEMLANTELQDLPERKEAEKMMQQLGGRS